MHSKMVLFAKDTHDVTTKFSQKWKSHNLHAPVWDSSLYLEQYLCLNRIALGPTEWEILQKSLDTKLIVWITGLIVAGSVNLMVAAHRLWHYSCRQHWLIQSAFSSTVEQEKLWPEYFTSVGYIMVVVKTFTLRIITMWK